MVLVAPNDLVVKVEKVLFGVVVLAPSFSVAPLATVIVPPDGCRLNPNVLASSTPAVIDALPATRMPEASVAVPDALLMTRWPNVVLELVEALVIVCAPVPLRVNVTLALLVSVVLEFVKLPLIRIELLGSASKPGSLVPLTTRLKNWIVPVANAAPPPASAAVVNSTVPPVPSNIPPVESPQS